MDSFKLMIETLRMLKSLGDRNEISYILEELEGDFRTFLHIDNLKKYKEQGLIDDFQLEVINRIVSIISNIPIKKWNPIDFKENRDWAKSRLLASYLLNDLDFENN